MEDHDLAIPILPTRSPAATIAFYARLGFAGETVGGDDGYTILTRGEVELHLFLHRELDPRTSSAGCYIRVRDAAAWYRAFQVAQLPLHGIPRMDRLEPRPWGMTEFAVVDEDGNLLRIGQIT